MTSQPDNVTPFPANNLSSFHNDVFQNTLLGRLCGKKQLFRNRYLVLRLLGRGGFGVTFLARDFSLPGKPFCVIKQLCPRVSEIRALETARRRFKREAQTLAALGSHSQIPLLLDYFVIGEDFYLVQEYIRGATLARLVRRQGCQSEVIVKRLLREMLLLLKYVHDQGVIHRDIKPQNIILAQDGRLVLIDFGAVKEELAQVAESTAKCPTTHFVGTVGFAPPEQVALRPVFASDIYALGMTCLYLLTGKAPLDFKTDRTSGTLQWQERVQISKPLAQVFDKMLHPSLKERYALVTEILADIDRLSPQDNLSQCMNLQPSTPRTEPPAPDRPASATTRTAQAIRGWRSRQENKGTQWGRRESMVSSS